MRTSIEVDNRDLGQMNRFLESRVDALKRALQDAQTDNSRLLALVDQLSRQNDELQKDNALLRLEIDVLSGVVMKVIGEK